MGDEYHDSSFFSLAVKYKSKKKGLLLGENNLYYLSKDYLYISLYLHVLLLYHSL